MKLLLALAATLAAGPAFAQDPTAGAAPEQRAATAPAAGQDAQATGQIKAVDLKAGTVTIHHSPISALGWPAMTMTFKATPEALQVAKAGQTVTFTLKTPENQVVAIKPQ